MTGPADQPIPGTTAALISACHEAVARSRALYAAHLEQLATTASDARPEWPRTTEAVGGPR